MDNVSKYLAGYAEPEAALPLQLPRHYQNSLVVPAFAETAFQLSQVWRDIPGVDELLVILVINAPEADPVTQSLAEELLSTGRVHELAEGLSLRQASGSPDLLIVDRYSQSRHIPPKQGVGLARKIGCDLALRFWHEGSVISDWLRTTDADAILPDEYFADIELDAAACLYPFGHVAEPGYEIPIQLYEIYLLYYVAGLMSAGSPYAFPTIGSIISCQAEKYAAVRGFPRRATGEDFYLLNKLRKLGDVRIEGAGQITLAGRPSTRVPVGTGQSVLTLSKEPEPTLAYQFDHPGCFNQLNHLLQYMAEVAANRPPLFLHPDNSIQAWCDSSGLCLHYENVRNRDPSQSVLAKSLHDWFDALRTRQFIRQMKDNHFGTLSIQELSATSIINIAWQGDSTLKAITRRLQAIVFNR